MKKLLSFFTPLPLKVPLGRKPATQAGMQASLVQPQASWERLSAILAAQAHVYAVEMLEVEKQADDMALREAGHVCTQVLENLPREASR